jgi:hypothetical protein
MYAGSFPRFDRFDGWAIILKVLGAPGNEAMSRGAGALTIQVFLRGSIPQGPQGLSFCQVMDGIASRPRCPGTTHKKADPDPEVWRP